MKVVRSFLVMVMTVTIFMRTYAQVLTPKYVTTTPNSGGYYEYLPQGYNTGNNNYPLLIFLHGLGELGNGTSAELPRLLNTGLPQRLNSGQFPTSFTRGGQTFRFIIISPQFKNWPSAWDVNEILNYVLQNYRVDQSRIYVSGLSMGGGVTWEYAGAYASRVAAIVPICGASGPDPGRAQNMVNAHIAVWGTHNEWDPTVPSSNTKGYVDLLNQYGANPVAKKTIFQVSGHDAWTQTYDPNFRENNMNVFEWMLQYQKGTTIANQPPTVSAGTNQSITLPVNSVTLNGSGSDPDGTIVSYSWTKVSGGNVSFSSPSSASTTVNGLAQGSYVFRLTVTDNAGASASSDVSVMVNAAQVSPPSITANDLSSYLPYTGKYSYGVNQGYYGSNWSSQSTATLATGSSTASVKGVGARSFRVPLYDDFLTTWGLNNLIPDFEYYKSLGAAEITAFVGHPHATHQLDTTFPGATEKSKVFTGMYEPIWLDAAKTQINPKNTYAKYLYEVVKTYGQYVKFWEIVNEPDFTYGTGGWYGDVNPRMAGSWFDRSPTADELVNLKSPVQYYIRMLRVSWDVIKKLSPNSYVCTGGIGYKSFLDALLRKTDNPVDGSVTNDYPLKGGAYFDVLSFHTYPMYQLKYWDNASGTVKHTRHSDGAATAFVNFKNNMDSVLKLYGYNGVTYPQKQFICTETGVSRIMGGEDWGSNEGQKNYMIKAQIAAQKNGIKQTYWFQLGDGANASEQFDQMGLYYYFGNNAAYNTTTTDQGKALKTTSDLLYNKVYDAARTASLNLPLSVDGGAFKAADGSYIYVLWAKTNTDLSENASATYSFPSNIVSGNLTRKEWNFSETASSTVLNSNGIQLTASPSFFEITASSLPPVNQPPVANAGSNQTITLPVNTAVLNGSGSDPDGSSVSYSWAKISGADVSFSNAASASATVNGLAQGSYVFRLTVTDNAGASASSDVSVMVNATPNQLPSANAGADQTITLPANSVTLNGSGSDADGTIAGYNWSQVSGPSQASIGTSSQASTTIKNLIQGIYTFSLTVTDNKGAPASDHVTITVNAAAPANQLPVVNAGTDQTITLPANTVNLSGIASDADGSIASHQWTKISGPASYTIASATSSATAVSGLTQGVYVFRYTATDNKEGSSSDDVQVTVNAAILPPNITPVASAGQDISITLPVSKVQLNGSGTDADGTITAYQWTMIDGPSAFQIVSPSSAKTNVTGLVEGTYKFKLTVTDNAGTPASDTVMVTVKPTVKTKSSASVYPNPATSTINVKIDAVTVRNNSELKIYNAAGILVYTETFIRTEKVQIKQINISGLDKGMYLVNVNADINTNVTTEFIKQ